MLKIDTKHFYLNNIKKSYAYKSENIHIMISLPYQAGPPAMLTAWPALSVPHGCSQPCRCTRQHPPKWCWTDGEYSPWMICSAGAAWQIILEWWEENTVQRTIKLLTLADLFSPSEPWGQGVLPGSDLVRWHSPSATAPLCFLVCGLYTSTLPDHQPLLWCFLGNLELSEA